MAKSKKKLERTSDSQLLRRLSSGCTKLCRDSQHKKRKVDPSEKKEWKDALCSVCMEFPHNSVLLLCSSYDKGCRPYMCATSSRYSNCLEQYRKAYTKTGSNDDICFPEESSCVDGKRETPELSCPLCRGQVKGWTVVNPARRYLNKKKRTCMKDNCSYVGNYKEIKQHVKTEHPRARPRAVDPKRAEKWKKFETETDLNDVFSTIRSTMPGSTVVGDYVIERRNYFYGTSLFSRVPQYRSRLRRLSDVDSDESLDSDFPYDEFFGVSGARSSVASRQLRRDAESIVPQLRSTSVVPRRSTGSRVARTVATRTLRTLNS